MKIVESLNSNAGYLSAIHRARMLEVAVASAEEGRPVIDFAQKIHEIGNFQQRIKARTKQGDVPKHLQSVHRLLEGMLDDLTKRVSILSKRTIAVSVPEKNGLGLNITLSGLGLAAAGGLGLFLFWPTKKPDVFSEEKSRQTAEEETPPPDEPSAPLLEEETHVEEEPQDQIREEAARLSEDEEIPSTEPTDEPSPPLAEEELQDQIREDEARPSDDEEISSTEPSPLLAEEELHLESKMAQKTIAEYVRDLFVLLEIGLAGHAIDRAKPWMALVGLHRAFHVARLSNIAPELTKTMPHLAAEMERAAALYSQIEANMPISASRVLEGMTSLDRLALVGFLDLVPNIPAVQGLAHAGIPGLSFLASDFAWSFIKFIPFLESALPLSSSNEPAGGTPDAEFTEYVRDLSLIGEIYLASRAIQNAKSFLMLTAVHRFFHIIKLCNLTENLREKMPLLVDGVEKAADAYSWIEEKLPFSTSEILERMTHLDSWAAVGFLDLIRNAPGVQTWTGGIPILSSLLTDRAWSIVRLSPFLLGPVALSLANIPFG